MRLGHRAANVQTTSLIELLGCGHPVAIRRMISPCRSSCCSWRTAPFDRKVGQSASVGGNLIAVVTFDRSEEPILAIAPAGFTNIDAQAWVRDNRTPMLVMDGGIQFVLVFEDSGGSVVISPFWRIVNLGQALSQARIYLRNAKLALWNFRQRWQNIMLYLLSGIANV